MKNNIWTKNPYFRQSELIQISVDFRHRKIFLISKMYSNCLYACVVFVLLHETIGAQKIIGYGRGCSAKSGNGPKLENIASFVNRWRTIILATRISQWSMNSEKQNDAYPDPIIEVKWALEKSLALLSIKWAMTAPLLKPLSLYN